MTVEERIYRGNARKEGLVAYQTVVQETDLHIQAHQENQELTRDLIIKHRGFLENYINRYPAFIRALKPWPMRGFPPRMVRDMISAAKAVNVGPMAAVAGVIAEYVGKDLLNHSPEIIVENGGDTFIKVDEPITVGVFAGKSPLSLKIGLQLDTSDRPLSVCTSSGTIGHSKSFGVADAVCVVSSSGALADAAATAMGNILTSKKNIQKAIDLGRSRKKIQGVVVIMDDCLGIWGDLEIVSLE
jgi:ApbE superfamily uncharacterized protein (UPF0280 family)